MKYKVTAIAVNLTQTPPSYTPPREETIDTEDNDLFKGCETLQSVEVAYERFWNYINSPDEVHNPSQKVKVLSVERLSD